MTEKSTIIFKYQADGYDRTGFKISDFPILYLLLEKNQGKKISGPSIIDTGFDGPIFANEPLALFLEDISKEDEKVIGGFGTDEFTCEIFKINAYLANSDKKIVKSLGKVSIFVPINLNYLSEYVIIGRELLNNIELCLNGKETTVIP